MVSIAAFAGKAHCHGYRNGNAMRHVLASFLTLHWAVVFALLAFACVDGGHGVVVMFSMLGATVPGHLAGDLENIAVAAPLAIAFMVVSILFIWAFIEVFVGDKARPQEADGVIRIAFSAAAGVLLLILIGGTACGVTGLLLVAAIHLTAILASYLVMLGERWSLKASDHALTGKIPSPAKAMAKAAAVNSTLVRFSSRTGTTAGKAF
jgi:hypothetical protein